MESPKPEISHDISPYLHQYTDGTVLRLAGTDHVPPGFDPLTQVTSKDTLIIPHHGVSARLYRPAITTRTHHHGNNKLPLVVYFHGGAFLIASPAEPKYHHFCNTVAAAATAVVVSVDYRLAPEHPLPAAFEDAWAAVQWIATHGNGDGPEEWLNEIADLNRVFLAGDSAGATLAHHVASQVGSGPRLGLKIEGIALIHLYFWGKNPIGSERSDPRKALVDKWWEYVCQSGKGADDPLINPFVDGALGPEMVEGERMLVMVAEKDVLRERGKLYYEEMVKRWKGKVEYVETQGEDHVFFIFDPSCQKAVELVNQLANFINPQKN